VVCRWINLESATDNADKMRSLCSELEIKNNERFPAIVLPSPEGTRPSETHYVGVGQSHINCLDSVKDELPALIFEDDVAVTEHYKPIIEVPDHTDAIYLGISHGDGNYIAEDIGGGMARIARMLAAHAVIYLTDRYLSAVSEVAHKCLYENKQPFDLGTYNIQQNFMVVTPHLPFFYQKHNGESLNNWEDLTRTPLRISNPAFSGPVVGPS